MVRRRGEMGPKHPISPLAADSGAPRPTAVPSVARTLLVTSVLAEGITFTTTSISSTSSKRARARAARPPRPARRPPPRRRARAAVFEILDVDEHPHEHVEHAAALRQRSRSRAQWNLLAGTDPHLTGGYMRVPLRAGGFGLRETSGTPGRRSTIDQVALLGARFSHPVVPAHTDAGRSTVSLRTANAGLHVA